MPTNLTEHFTLDELIASETAQARHIDNTPGSEIVEHLHALAAGLELVRTALGNRPMHIDSGYRCPVLNKDVGGVADSAHVTGYAADFVCPDYGVPLDIVRHLAAAGIHFDQLIQEGTWVHISFDPQMRGEVLTAHFIDGHATYERGVPA